MTDEGEPAGESKCVTGVSYESAMVVRRWQTLLGELARKIEIVVGSDREGRSGANTHREVQVSCEGEFWILVVKLLRAYGGCLGVRRR